MINHLKRGAAVTLALTFLVLAAAPKTAYGAEVVETSRKCQAAFSLENLKETEGPEDPGLTGDSGISVFINLYKVADVTEYGKYTVTASGEGAKDLQAALSGVNADTKPEEWLEMADQAAALVGLDLENEVFPNTGIRRETEADKTVTFTDLDTGLYLVAAEPAESMEYRYTFTPYLLSLPDNRYQTDSQDDTWIYDLTGKYMVGLKASREQRYGSLVIEKDLLSYNETLGSTAFVFRIDAVKGNFHYSDVVSLKFDGPGTAQTLPITDKIPAGASVTVTEVYSGAGYRISGTSVKTIPAITAEDETTVTFANVYDEDSLKGGSSIVNHFPYTEPDDPEAESRGGVWDVEQQSDSSAQGRGI